MTLMALADESMTYPCAGQSTEESAGNTLAAHSVTRDYTLDVSR